jgi:hypothetical protein
VVIVLFDFWLVADQEIVAIESPHDDAWCLQKAQCWYWFDEGYSNMSFIKEPIFSLFAAVCYRLGLPLRLATEAVYLAAAGFLAWCLVTRQTRASIGLLVFVACALHPMHFHVFQGSTYSVLYPSVLMLALGALLLQFKLRNEAGRWRRWLLSGVALALVWNTRPERPLVLLLILFFLAAAAFRDWRRSPNVGGGLRAWLGEWSPPLALLTAITLAIMSANYLRWGTFAINDLLAPGFSEANRALMSIKPRRPEPYVPVSKEARERAYAVSPSFRELAPFLDGPDGAAWAGGHGLYNLADWAGGHGLYNLPRDEFAAAWFIYALRDAAAAAGHYQSARDSEDFYRRIAEEIDAAAAEGRLPTRWVPPFYMDPCFDNYQHKLLPSWRAVWCSTWRSGYGATQPDASEVSAETKALFDRVACRRAITQEQPTAQERMRIWIGTGYGHAMEIAVAVAGLVVAAVLLLPRAAPGSGEYLLCGAAFAVAGFSRLALFTLIDASSFPGREDAYIFPAALALTIMAVWLLAEGLRLLGGTGCRLLWSKMTTHDRLAIGSRLGNGHHASAKASPDPSPGGAGRETCCEETPFVGKTPQPYGRTRVVVGTLLLLASSILLLRIVWWKGQLPDIRFEAGAIEQLDGEMIAGWARDRDQPNSAVEVNIYDGETLLATLQADGFRQELLDQGIGDGRHFFSYPTPVSLKDWCPHAIRVAFAGTNAELANSPKTVILPGDQVAPDNATVGGSLDGADGENIVGWAWDKNQPNSRIDVEIYEGDGVLTLLATVPASQFRQDLLDAKAGDGRHGFSYPTPARLKDGKAHTIRVVTSRAKVELDGSPKAITLKSP